MSTNGAPSGSAGLVSSLRRLARDAGASGSAAGEVEHCDVCGTDLDPEHRHLLHIEERRILCACEPCVAMRVGEGPYRPVGIRTLLLDDFDLPEDLWARLQVPIGLAFFMQSSVAGRVVGLYPSPAGATECELDLSAWEELCELNPPLGGLETDAEGLIVDRTTERHRYAIAPIDDCYRLVGMIKASWEGISGGDAVERGVAEFFDELGARAPGRGAAG